MPDLLAFHPGKDPRLTKARPDAAGIFKDKTYVSTNAYLVTVEITEVVEHTYLVPAFSPEEAERLLARGRQNYEEVQSSPVGIEAAKVVNIEPVASSGS